MKSSILKIISVIAFLFVSLNGKAQDIKQKSTLRVDSVINLNDEGMVLRVNVIDKNMPVAYMQSNDKMPTLSIDYPVTKQSLPVKIITSGLTGVLDPLLLLPNKGFKKP